MSEPAESVESGHPQLLAEPPPEPPPSRSPELHPPTFSSILFDRVPYSDEPAEPAYFHDLNLDQLVDSITTGLDEYNLKPFFYQSLHDPEVIQYRHDIFRDLENSKTASSLGSFTLKMQEMREHLKTASELRYQYQKESWFLDAVAIYCDAVTCLARDLADGDATSRGLLDFRAYLSHYADSSAFTRMAAETQEVKHSLAQIVYSVHIKGAKVTVRKYGAEADYSAEVQNTFERFAQGKVKSHNVGFSNLIEMNHVEGNILDLVARLFADEFAALDAHHERYRDFIDATVRDFDRELQFYAAYREFTGRFDQTDVQFCYPDVSTDSKEILADDTFDLVLADKLLEHHSSVVTNDFFLRDPERILVVSGPNQGGKTTFARTFGQLHHLAGLGLPVPGSRAKLFLSDSIFVHFEREEDIDTLTGKLEDDLVRMRKLLTEATPNSIIITNEIYTSTTLEDALFLGRKTLEEIIRLGALCVYVTFIDELASMSESTVSMVSTVVPEDPAQRTFKVVRKPAEGLAFAEAIARKYGLSYETLAERIRP